MKGDVPVLDMSSPGTSPIEGVKQVLEKCKSETKRATIRTRSGDVRHGPALDVDYKTGMICISNDAGSGYVYVDIGSIESISCE